MTFRSEMHHIIEFLLFKKSKDCLPVRNICLHETIVPLIPDLSMLGQITGVSQQIQVNYIVIGIVINHVMDKIPADKTGTAGNQQFLLTHHLHLRTLY
ncbi:hypothetical protein D3C75_717480 [compost metagenome]